MSALLVVGLCTASAVAAAPDTETIPAESSDATRVKPELLKTDGAATRGSPSAAVTVVVFSDFQCPYCARGSDIMRAIENRYGNKVQLVFRHNPLPIHKEARLAAAAGVAAQQQGRFWELHDRMFTNQRQLDRASLELMAEAAGLDMGRFRAALDSPATEMAVAADQEQAARLGARGTPTFFVNGRRISGAQPVETFARVIDDELSR